MNFSLLPPEINSALMYSGAGSTPMLEAAAAWEGLAAELGSAAASFGSVTSGLLNESWQGAASTAMAGAAAPYVSWLNAAAAGAQGASAQAKAAAAVFESALAATVHPAAVAVNRTRLVQLVTSNWLGLNGPAIADAEALYERLWAQDVAAMSGYHAGVSAVAAQLTPWQAALQNLQSLSGQVSSSAAAAGLAGVNSSILNLGLGNTGLLNVGSGNTGDANLGSGNTGHANVGSGNNGSANLIAAVRDRAP